MKKEENKKPFYIRLKESRESKGVDLETISSTIKVNISYLQAIENGDLDIVPPTYLRLFVRSYAKYLNMDNKIILKEYEEEINVKSKNIFKNLKKDKNINQETTETRKLFAQKKETTKEKNEANNKNLIFDESQNQVEFISNENYFFKPKKVISITLTFVLILCFYLFISYLNNSQKKNIVNINSQNNIIVNKIIEESENILSEVDNFLLSQDNFDKSKFIDTKSEKLKYSLDSPYSFQIVTKEKTKLYISYDDENGIRKEQCNIIAKKDSLLKFKKTNNIYFDLWSAKHVEIAIENKSIAKYLGRDDFAVRGSFSPKNKLLYLEFYSH